MLGLCGLPLINIGGELVVLGLGFLIPLVQDVLFLLLVDLALLGEVVLRQLVPLPLVVNLETLLDEPQQLLLPLELPLFALRQLHATEKCLVVRNLSLEQLDLLHLALCEIFLPRVFSQVGHGSRAGLRVVR